MKALAVLSLFAIAMSAPERDGDLYDMFDAKEILENKDLTTKALDCLMDRAPCGEFQPIRDKVPRILQTKCGDCTPEQKLAHEETLKTFEHKYNADYKKLLAKFT